jgi:hypothetical protein
MMPARTLDNYETPACWAEQRQNVVLIERKLLKLLAQAAQTLNQIVGEGLCDEPQKKLMQAMLAELRGMLDEFEESYFGG